MKFEDDNLESMCARKTVDCDDSMHVINLTWYFNCKNYPD